MLNLQFFSSTDNIEMKQCEPYVPVMHQVPNQSQPLAFDESNIYEVLPR